MDFALDGLRGLPLNAVDLALGLLVVFGAWSGWRRGLISAGLELAILLCALAAAWLGYHLPARWVAQQWPAMSIWAPPLSFILTFIVLHLVLKVLAGVLVAKVPPHVHGHAVNRVLGAAPGAVTGVINATIVALILLTLPLSFLRGPSNLARDSAIARALTPPGEWLESRITTIFEPAVRQSLPTRMVIPDSDASIPLSFRVASPGLRRDLEVRLLEMVNEERATQGLRPLLPDPEMAEVARAHSRDMLARGYFSHTSPDGKSPFDRMRQSNVRFLLAGENLALAPTLPLAHQGLMNSPGHRANILRPQFGRVGIGVLDGGVHGLMVAQNFRN